MHVIKADFNTLDYASGLPILWVTLLILYYYNIPNRVLILLNPYYVYNIEYIVAQNMNTDIFVLYKFLILYEKRANQYIHVYRFCLISYIISLQILSLCDYYMDIIEIYFSGRSI